MSKLIYYHLQLVGLRETVPSGNILDTIIFNGYDTGVNKYYFVLGNTLPQPQGYDADYLEYTISEATFTAQNTNQTVPVQTEIETLQFPVWVSKVVPDNFVIPSAPDLTVHLDKLSPTTLSPTSTLSASISIYNKGTQTASSSKVGIYLSDDATITTSDTLLAAYDSGALAGGAIRDLTYNGLVSQLLHDIPGGTHYIGIIIDPNNAVNEGAKENNNVSNAIKITSKAPTPPDLQVSLKSVGPASVASNGTLDLDYTLKNAGGTRAGVEQVTFYLSKDSKIDSSDMKWFWWDDVSLGAGESSHRVENFGLYDIFPAGKYYVGAIIDSDGRVSESNEGNNASNGIAITITGPNANPIAGDDVATTTYGKPVKIDILANDSDPNPGDKLTFVVAADDSHHGSVKINSDKTITYTPDWDFLGIDTFTYTLYDDHGGHAEATVAVGVDWLDPMLDKGALRAKGDPYSWDFYIPTGNGNTYTFTFEVTKPTTLDAVINCGPDISAELIADPHNIAPTLGLGPDRIAKADDGSRISSEKISITDPLMPGKYSLVLTREQETTFKSPGKVDLWLSPDEAGNRIEWATPIKVGRSVKGEVDVIDNKDIYKFTLKEQSSVLVSLAVDGYAVGIDGVPPIHYEIMTNAQALDYYHVLESNTDAASRYVSSAYTAPELTDVANNPLDAGDYYIIIYHPENIIAPPQDLQTFKYNLWVNSWVDNAANRPLTTDFGAQGPKSANIGDITGTTYKNHDFLGLADANDYYMFSLASRQTVTVGLKQASKSVSMDLVLTNMAGGGSTDIIVDAVETGGGTRSIIATLDAGTYFLKASTDTDFHDPNGTSKYGTSLVLPNKGGGYYDLTIKSDAPVSAPGIILGTSGADNYKGSSGADRFNGKAGNDRIMGGDGDDFLAGDKGADTLIGGNGHDTFAFLTPADGPDTIEDFVSGDDRIGIVKSAFGMAKVAMNAADAKYDFALHYFVSGAGAVATEAHGQLLFDTSSHTLIWDANGTGAGGQKVLATLSNGANVTANDFELL